MDHIVIPLDASHAAAEERVARATPCGGPMPSTPLRPHITIASYDGLAPRRARAAIEPVATRTRPFVVRAHGYGLFVGERPHELNVHVPVIRGPELESLRGGIHAALAAAGALLAAWIGPDEWSPHITLVDGAGYHDDPGPIVARLLARRHPSWNIGVNELAVSTVRDRRRHWDRVPFPLDSPA